MEQFNEAELESFQENRVTLFSDPGSVMLSGAGVQRSGTPAQSKHPYPKHDCCGLGIHPLGITSPQTIGLGLQQFLRGLLGGVKLERCPIKGIAEGSTPKQGKFGSP